MISNQDFFPGDTVSHRNKVGYSGKLFVARIYIDEPMDLLGVGPICAYRLTGYLHELLNNNRIGSFYGSELTTTRMVLIEKVANWNY
jgi:hypothetical protein